LAVKPHAKVMLLLALGWLCTGSLQPAPREVQGSARPELSPPLLLSDPLQSTGEPKVAVGPGGEIYIVWDGNPPSGCNSNVYFARSLDGGSSFSAPVSLSNLGCPPNEAAWHPEVAVDAAGTLYVVWVYGGPSDFGIYFVRSTDAGGTFTAPKNISRTAESTGAFVPELAAGAVGEVIAVWLDEYEPYPGQSEQIFFTRSTDSGDTFSAPVQVSFRWTPEWSASSGPAVSTDALAQLYAGWDQGRIGAAPDVLLVASYDGGQTFSAPVNLSEGLGASGRLRIASETPSRVYAIWQMLRPRSWETMFRRSLDGGATFSELKRLSRGGHGSSIPQGIAVGRPEQVCAVWEEVNKGFDIFMRCSFNGGENFRKEFNATGRRGHFEGDIALDAAGSAYLVFGCSLRGVNPDYWWWGVCFRRSLEPLQ